MALATGLIALAVLGSDGPSVDCGGAVPYQVRVMTLDGLEWRTEAYPKLKPVARQGTSSIWTAEKALGETLADSARSVTVTPRCALGGDQAVVKVAPVYYQGHWERVADGPIGHATKLAWKPETSKLEEGFRAKVACRTLDQGILAHVVIEESHVNAIHKVLQAENFKTPNGMKVDFVPAGKGGPNDVTGFQTIQQAVGGKETALGCYVQIPEISSARIEGEWLVPTGSVLVMTLGVDTVADDQGKAVVRERVAVIDFEDGSTAPTKDEAAAAPAPRAEVVPAPPVLVGALPMPAMPSRSTPEAIDVDGKLVDLPPLPEGIAGADLNTIASEPDRPSPQMVVSKSSSVDREIAQASFVPDVASPPGVKGNVPLASAPSSCFLRKLIASGISDGYDIDVITEEDGKTIRLGVNSAPKCDDCRGVEADARAAAGQPAEPAVDARLSRSAFFDKVMHAFDKMAGTDDACPMAQGCPAAAGKVAAAEPEDMAGRVEKVFKQSDLMNAFDVSIQEVNRGKTLFITVSQFEPKAESIRDDASVARSEYANKVAQALEKKASPADCPVADDCPADLASLATAAARAALASLSDPAMSGLVKVAVNVRDGKGAEVTKVEAPLGAALKNPGQTETAYVNLPGNFRLELKATLVPPDGAEPYKAMVLPQAKYFTDDVQYFHPGPEFPYANTNAATKAPGDASAKLKALQSEVEALRKAAEDLKTPAMPDAKPSQMRPFRTQGGNGP